MASAIFFVAAAAAFWVANAAYRRVLQDFRGAGATPPNRAQALRPFDWIAERQLHRLIDHGIVRQDEPGRYYLDEHELVIWERRQNQLGFLIVLGALLIVGIIFFS